MKLTGPGWVWIGTAWTTHNTWKYAPKEHIAKIRERYFFSFFYNKPLKTEKIVVLLIKILIISRNQLMI